jgi:hypothetical protein
MLIEGGGKFSWITSPNNLIYLEVFSAILWTRPTFLVA